MKLILDDGFEIPFEKVFIADVPAGAVLILEHPGILTQNAINNIREIVFKEMGLKALVLQEDMHLSCILKSDATLKEDYK